MGWMDYSVALSLWPRGPSGIPSCVRSSLRPGAHRRKPQGSRSRARAANRRGGGAGGEGNGSMRSRGAARGTGGAQSAVSAATSSGGAGQGLIRAANAFANSPSGLRFLALAAGGTAGLAASSLFPGTQETSDRKSPPDWSDVGVTGTQGLAAGLDKVSSLIALDTSAGALAGVEGGMLTNATAESPDVSRCTISGVRGGIQEEKQHLLAATGKAEAEGDDASRRSVTTRQRDDSLPCNASNQDDTVRGAGDVLPFPLPVVAGMGVTAAAAAVVLNLLPPHLRVMALSPRGLGPMSLSLLWTMAGTWPGESADRREGKEGLGNKRSVVGIETLDWLDRGLLRMGAARFGWRPPTSLTDRLVAVSSVVYVLDVLMHKRLTLWGAKVNWLITAKGQFWRLLTPALLHGSAFHLAMNMASLRNVGPALETLLGPRRFLTLYATSAVAGCAMSTALNPSPSVGASGALFGLLGALAVFFFRNRDALIRSGKEDYFPVLARTVALNLFIGAVPPNIIDNWGHIGGLLGGAALMTAYMNRK